MQGMGKGGRKAEFKEQGEHSEPGRLFLRGREEQDQGLPETGGLPARAMGNIVSTTHSLTHTI